MLLLTLMMACDPNGEGRDTAPQDTDTASDEVDLDALKSWENMPVKIEFVLKNGLASGSGTEEVEGDTVVVFVPLEAPALPTLGFWWDVSEPDADAGAKAINHDASRSNNTNSVILKGGSDVGSGHVDILKAAQINWDQDEPCMGTVEECMSQGSPAELNVNLIDSSAFAYDLHFGHTFRPTKSHEGEFIVERVDRSTPLVLSGSSQDGWAVSGESLARFQVFDGDKLVATHGPYQDWGEVLRTLGDLPVANHVSTELVEGGMLLTLAWDGGQEHEDSWGTMVRSAWEQPTDTELYWMDRWEPQGGQFGPELKNIEISWLGFAPSTEWGEVSITSTLRASYGAHERYTPLALSVPADREGGSWEELDLSLNGQECLAPCVSTAQTEHSVLIRKRPGRMKVQTQWGVAGAGGAEAGTATGQVRYEQSGDTMVMDYGESGTSVRFESESGECRVCLGEPGSTSCQTIVLECGKEYSIEASLPVAFESTLEGREYHAGLVF